MKAPRRQPAPVAAAAVHPHPRRKAKSYIVLPHETEHKKYRCWTQQQSAMKHQSKVQTKGLLRMLTALVLQVIARLRSTRWISQSRPRTLHLCECFWLQNSWKHILSCIDQWSLGSVSSVPMYEATGRIQGSPNPVAPPGGGARLNGRQRFTPAFLG